MTVPGGYAPGTYPYTVLDDSPLVWARCDESSGATSLADSSGNSRPFSTIVGSPTYGVASKLTAQLNTAISLAGSDYATQANPAWLKSQASISVEAWFKTTGTGTYGLCCLDDVAFSPVSNLRNFSLYVSNGLVAFQNYTTAGGAPVPVSPLTYKDGNWHHVVATRDTTNLTLYVDGVQVSQVALGGTYNGSGVSAPLTLGCTTQSGQTGNVTWKMVGSIDEVAVYATALSAARVLAHYQAVVPPAPAAGFTGWGMPI